MDASVVADYTAHLDAKHRLTLRGAKYAYYQVKEYDYKSTSIYCRISFSTRKSGA